MRLFFALYPDPEASRRIESTVTAIGLPVSTRSIAAANYHLTLAFAGDVSNVQAAALRSGAAAVRLPPFEVRLDVCEYWPKSEVIVAAASEHAAELVELHRHLRDDLDRIGVASDPRPFRPHITLARKVTQAPVLKVMSAALVVAAREFKLVHSSRYSKGSVYTVVDSWPLLDKDARAR